MKELYLQVMEEIKEYGSITTSTYMYLTSIGVDADRLEESINAKIAKE